MVVLYFIATVIFVYVLLFADSAERAVVKSVLMGSVVAVIVAMLLLLYALDRPFNTGIGGLQPVAMERTRQMIDEELAVAGADVTPPCDAAGTLLRARQHTVRPQSPRPAFSCIAPVPRAG